MSLDPTIQESFGNVSVNKYNGSNRCDRCVGYKGNGEPMRCTNTASIAILRHYTGVAEFYCKIHSKDSWVEMAEQNNE